MSRTGTMSVLFRIVSLVLLKVWYLIVINKYFEQINKWALADGLSFLFCFVFFFCLEFLPSFYLAGYLIFMFFKTQLVSPLPNTAPMKEITASFLSMSFKHLDCYTHNTHLQLLVYMALLTIRLWAPWGRQLDLIYIFIPSIQWHILDAHRCLGSEAIEEPYIF